jgi:hypothetical protein
VKGEIIDFIADPPSSPVYPSNTIAKEHVTQIDKESSNLLNTKVIVASRHEPGEYISPIFSVPKKDNKVRFHSYRPLISDRRLLDGLCRPQRRVLECQNS